MKKVDEKKTLEYAVAFYLQGNKGVNFSIGKRLYTYVDTVYDYKTINLCNTIVVLYDYTSRKYISIPVDHHPLGNKEITILN